MSFEGVLFLGFKIISTHSSAIVLHLKDHFVSRRLEIEFTPIHIVGRGYDSHASERYIYYLSQLSIHSLAGMI
jgi:hypothetical protein